MHHVQQAHAAFQHFQVWLVLRNWGMAPSGGISLLTFFNAPVLHSSLLLPWEKHQVESAPGTTRTFSVV